MVYQGKSIAILDRWDNFIAHGGFILFLHFCGGGCWLMMWSGMAFQLFFF
jgi:hypothetical protein